MVSWGTASLPVVKSWDVHLVQGSTTSSPYTAKSCFSQSERSTVQLIVCLPSGNRTLVICKPPIVDIVKLTSKLLTSESYFRLAPSTPPLSFSMAQGMTELPTLQEHHRSYLTICYTNLWIINAKIPRLIPRPNFYALPCPVHQNLVWKQGCSDHVTVASLLQ